MQIIPSMIIKIMTAGDWVELSLAGAKVTGAGVGGAGVHGLGVGAAGVTGASVQGAGVTGAGVGGAGVPWSATSKTDKNDTVIGPTALFLWHCNPSKTAAKHDASSWQTSQHVALELVSIGSPMSWPSMVSASWVLQNARVCGTNNSINISIICKMLSHQNETNVVVCVFWLEIFLTFYQHRQIMAERSLACGSRSGSFHSQLCPGSLLRERRVRIGAPGFGCIFLFVSSFGVTLRA